MTFAGLHARAPGVHDAHETYENAVQWGDPLFQNFYRMQAWIGPNAVDLGNHNPKQNGKAISGISQAADAVVTTSSPHGLSDGDRVSFKDVGGMTEINGQIGTVASATATTFATGINSSGFGAYTSGGFVLVLGPEQVLRPGLIMGYHTANKVWEHWQPGASNGTENIQGYLYVEQQMNIMGVAEGRWRGFVVWGGPIQASRIIIPGEVNPGIEGHAQEATIRAATQWVMDDYFQQ